MLSPNDFAHEMERHIRTLVTSNVRLSLMSLANQAWPTARLADLAEDAAAPADLVGPLVDGTIGILSLRAIGPDGGAGTEHRLLAALCSALARRDFPAAGFRFRAVHRWAAEIVSGDDLQDCLFDSRSQSLSLAIDTERAGVPPYSLPDRRRWSVPRWSAGAGYHRP